MAGGFPFFGDYANQQVYGLSAGLPTFFTTGAANTKGSWVQIVASTSADCACLEIYPFYFGGTSKTMSFDLGIGASGSEIILVADLVVANPGASSAGGYAALLPLSIPAGTRLAGRAQSTVASDAQPAALVMTYDTSIANIDGLSGCDTIGFLSASSAGTAVTPNATSNVKGSYVQLTASTTRDYQGFMVRPDIQAGIAVGLDYTVDIAVGASGSEVVIYDFYFSSPVGPFTSPIPMAIPSGTRIAARCSAWNSSAAAMGLTFYGLY